MADTIKTQIQLNVELDENRVPEKLNWSAQDGGVDNEEANSGSKKASKDDKILLGKIDGELVFLKSIIAIKSSEISYTILYNNNEFICDKKHKYYDISLLLKLIKEEEKLINKILN